MVFLSYLVNISCDGLWLLSCVSSEPELLMPNAGELTTGAIAC